MNLIVNGSFEDSKAGWTGTFTVDGCNPLYGDHAAILLPGPIRNARVAHVIPSLPEGSYELTAYCATNILDQSIVTSSRDKRPNEFNKVTVGASVNGMTSKTFHASIRANNGYQKYTVPFTLFEAGAVEVWFYAPNAKTGGMQISPAYAIIDVVTVSKGSVPGTKASSRSR